mmetsp:Transcript_760/g.2000  ORF Transcript_760/g.2000 Transcript_760/m.2000 type:complete len:349 (-) Transcript_760:20-1066(-)
MGAALVPPVHASKLDSNFHLLQLPHFLGTVPEEALDGHLRRTLLPHHLGHRREHPVPVVNQQVRVPLQEEVPVLCLVRSRLRVEEPSFPGALGVVSRIVRPSVAPLRMPHLLCLLLQVLEHVRVVALELANARETPPPITLWIRRIPHLPRGTKTHSDLRDDPTQVPLGRGQEGLDKVSVRLHRRPPTKDGLVVAPEGKALGVPAAGSVRVKYVRLLLSHLQDPVGQRNIHVVTDITTRSVEAHHGLHFQSVQRRHSQQLEIRVEVVFPWRVGLDHAPPHVHHHPRDASSFQSLQALVQGFRRLEHWVVHASNLLSPNCVQREHHVHWHLPSIPPPRSFPFLVFVLFE